MEKIYKNWLIILALLIVFGLGFYAYKNPPERTGNNNDQEINISSWKAYKDEKFGFEFLYPEDVTPRDDTQNAQALLYTLFDTRINDQSATRFASAVIEGNISENRDKFSGPLSSDLQDITLAGKQGFKVVYGDAGCAGESTVLPLKNNNTLVLSIGYCEGDLLGAEDNYKVFNKVLETLKIE